MSTLVSKLQLVECELALSPELSVWFAAEFEATNRDGAYSVELESLEFQLLPWYADASEPLGETTYEEIQGTSLCKFIETKVEAFLLKYVEENADEIEWSEPAGPDPMTLAKEHTEEK